MLYSVIYHDSVWHHVCSFYTEDDPTNYIAILQSLGYVVDEIYITKCR